MKLMLYLLSNFSYGIDSYIMILVLRVGVIYICEWQKNHKIILLLMNTIKKLQTFFYFLYNNNLLILAMFHIILFLIIIYIFSNILFRIMS